MDAVLCELGFPEEIIMTVDVGSFFTQFGQVWVTGKSYILVTGGIHDS